MLTEILSKYTEIRPQEDGFAIVCPFCKEEGHEKLVYFYAKSKRVICFRCRDVAKRHFNGVWDGFNKILNKLGVDKRTMATFNGSLNFVDFGKGVSTKIFTYEEHELISSKDSDKASKFLSGRNLDVNKVGEYVFYGVNGPMKNKVCVRLFPSGYQCRSLDIKDYRIYKEKHNHAVFCPDPITHVNDLFICEGPYDILNLFQYGFQGIATLGIHTSPYIKQIIDHKNVENVYVWFDSDTAGEEGFKKLNQFLISGFYDVYTIRTEKDPKYLTENEIREALTSAELVKVEEVYR